MKKEMIGCEVIQDLLPLYEDDCCSEQTRKLVEEHLRECDICGKKYNHYKVELPENEVSNEVEAKQIQSGVKRFIRWKKAGIASLCVVLLAAFVIIPALNAIRGEGLTYGNLKAVKMAYDFEKALASGDYEKAFTYLNTDKKYQDLIATDSKDDAVMKGVKEIEQKGFEWYNQEAKEKFLMNMMALEKMNEQVASYSGFHISKQSFGWQVDFNYVKTTSGREIDMSFDITPEGIVDTHVFVKSESVDFVMEEVTVEETEKVEERLLSILYTSPTINESVMGILYGETEFDWEGLLK